MNAPKIGQNVRTFPEVSPRDRVRQVRADRRGMKEVPLVLHYPERVHEVKHRFAKVSLLRLCNNETQYILTFPSPLGQPRAIGMPVQKGVVFLAMMSSGSHFSLSSTHMAIDDVASVVSVCSDHVVRSDTVGTAADALESVAFLSMVR